MQRVGYQLVSKALVSNELKILHWLSMDYFQKYFFVWQDRGNFTL
jgi:hypothetical protein